jgi:hypothetical protein
VDTNECLGVGPQNKSFAQITAEIEDAARKMYAENLKIAGFLCMMALAYKRGNASDEQNSTYKSLSAAMHRCHLTTNERIICYQILEKTGASQTHVGEVFGRIKAGWSFRTAVQHIIEDQDRELEEAEYVVWREGRFEPGEYSLAKEYICWDPPECQWSGRCQCVDGYETFGDALVDSGRFEEVHSYGFLNEYEFRRMKGPRGRCAIFYSDNHDDVYVIETFSMGDYPKLIMVEDMGSLFEFLEELIPKVLNLVPSG